MKRLEPLRTTCLVLLALLWIPASAGAQQEPQGAASSVDTADVLGTESLGSSEAREASSTLDAIETLRAEVVETMAQVREMEQSARDAKKSMKEKAIRQFRGRWLIWAELPLLKAILIEASSILIKPTIPYMNCSGQTIPARSMHRAQKRRACNLVTRPGQLLFVVCLTGSSLRGSRV